MIQGFSGMSYQERLQLLNLTTLETRRIHGDLIEVFKIFTGFEDVDAELFFLKSELSLCGHELKLVKPRARLDVRKYFFQ